MSTVVDFQAFAPRLEAALSMLGMSDDCARMDALLRYLQQLHHWNKAYNLTAIRHPADMLVQHVFDSLAIVPVLRAARGTRKTRVADMGSGAGLPGVILAICEPGWDIICADAVGKKTAFIRQAAGVLGLSNVQAVHGRIEKLPCLQADLIVSRAFASLVDFANLSGLHLAAGGSLWAMKGQYPDAEVEQLTAQTPWRVSGQTTLQVPELNAQRCLLHIARKEQHDS